jgi:hypothetical protein
LNPTQLENASQKESRREAETPIASRELTHIAGVGTARTSRGEVVTALPIQERTRSEGTAEAHQDPVGITDRAVEQISRLRADDGIGAETTSVELLALAVGLGGHSTGGTARAVDELGLAEKRADVLLEEPVKTHAIPDEEVVELVGPVETH